MCVCAQSLSRVWLFETLWTVALQAPCPRDFPGKNTGVSCHVLLQGIFQILYALRCHFPGARIGGMWLSSQPPRWTDLNFLSSSPKIHKFFLNFYLPSSTGLATKVLEVVKILSWIHQAFSNYNLFYSQDAKEVIHCAKKLWFCPDFNNTNI